MWFWVVKKRTLLLAFCVSLAACACLTMALHPFERANSPATLPYTVVLDAGHGGIDNGETGVNTNAKESEINLAIVKKVESYLVDFGFSVVLTRKNSDGLYGTTAKNFKIRDMKKRAEIINDTKPDLVLSVHCNSYPQSSVRGAQVFYSTGSEIGKNAAQKMQQVLANQLVNSNRKAMVGDYFILECSPHLSLIAECGFLSNPSDEALLITADYQEKVAYALFCGILDILIVA